MSDTANSTEARSRRGPTGRILDLYVHWATRRPWLTLALWLAVACYAAWLGSRLRVRQNLEDLFPESTPAVQAARAARAAMPSSSQMIVIFGSPSRDANRRLATAFCERARGWPDVASVECRRDVDFFRSRGALFLPVTELQELEREVDQRIRAATRSEMVGDAFGDQGDTSAGDDDDDDEDDEDDEDEDFGAPPTPTPAKAPPKPAKSASPAQGEAKPTKGRFTKLPTDEELRARLGSKDDLREWAESPDGQVLGVKLFPSVPAAEIKQSAKFVKKVKTLMSELDPKTFHSEMQVTYRGDYAEMSAEVGEIKQGLATTTGLALLGIALIQLFAFRRMRALLMLFIPLLFGVLLTVAFAQVAVGYLNLITAFIFGILFGLGNDFGVYTLSRYQVERAAGREPVAAARVVIPELWSALRIAALTTTVAFLSLTVFDFRGFSQFGLIAGVGVLLALLSTMALFPPLAVALHRLWPEGDAPSAQAQGVRLFGWFARPHVARWTLRLVAVLALVGAVMAPNLHFDTNFRKLRTPAKAKKRATAATAAQKLGNKYAHKAEKRTASPIMVLTDDMAHAAQIHEQLKLRSAEFTRINHFVSIHSFVPKEQDLKLPVIKRIRSKIMKKKDALSKEDQVEAERALGMLPEATFAPKDLPDFVRKRFLDVDGNLGRYVLLYANGNLADARSVKEVVEQAGTFRVGERVYRATASFFILAEADEIVRKEGPWAVLLAALAVLLVIGGHYRSLRLVLVSFAPLVVAFVIFLGLAAALELQLNLFSISVLPSIFGIGIDGTVHLVHRAWEVGPEGDLRMVLRRIGGAAWIASITTAVGFGALWFQANPGLQTIGSMAVVGILVVCTVANIIAGSWLSVSPVPGKTSASKV